MSLSRRDVERQLVQKLEMELSGRSSDDHRVYNLIIDGKRILRTKVSRGSGYKTLSADLVSNMARQLFVPAPFFRGLVDCTKSREEYLAILREKGVIED